MAEKSTPRIIVFVFSVFLLLLPLHGCHHMVKKKETISLPVSRTIIIDHKSTNISGIPRKFIDEAKRKICLYYAHTSHGEQPVVGLQLIMASNAVYCVSIDKSRLPLGLDAVSILDHQYVAPEGFWASPDGQLHAESIFESNPSINLCMWAWCGQLGSYSPLQVQEYLEAISSFEERYPDVIFVYMTGHAQYDGEKGYNRYKNNNIIRSWVRDHPEKKRVLFDFADLDSWWENPETGVWEQAIYSYWNGEEKIAVPVEHPAFHGDQQSHTTFESCRQKGRALWWMFSVLAGWQYQ